MRNNIYALAIASVLAAATSVPASAGCDAPYAGCLATCGNKVTGGTSAGSPGTLKAECKAQCQAAYRACICHSPGGGRHGGCRG
jgi:hypothetical protein